MMRAKRGGDVSAIGIGLLAAGSLTGQILVPEESGEVLEILRRLVTINKPNQADNKRLY
jgi:hypothetical protein